MKSLLAYIFVSIVPTEIQTSNSKEWRHFAFYLVMRFAGESETTTLWLLFKFGYLASLLPCMVPWFGSLGV